MTTQPPPSRYRIVERGRRLEVIDTRTASQPKTPLPLAGGARGGDELFPKSRGFRLPPRARASGAAGVDADTFVTKAFYDAKAPRTIRIDFITRKRLDGVRFGGAIAIALLVAFGFLFWPLAFSVFGFLLSDKVRQRLRAASTRFVDTLTQAA